MSQGVTVRIDPHVHSEASYDGHEPVDLLLEYAREIDLDGIVVTDHDEIDESLRAAELAPEFGLVGVPGVEVSTAHGHLLAIGVEECPAAGRPLDATIAEIHALGGAAVVPHPFQRSRHGVRKRHLVDEAGFDALEVYNSMVFTGYRNRRARRFADARRYPGVGASDAHYLPNVGRAYTEMDVTGAGSVAEMTAEHVVDAIRDGSTEIRGKRTPIVRSTRQYTRGAVMKATYALTSMAPLISARPASLAD